ncbi:hypothetical protein [Paenibacillus sp. YPG26]|uniref:hypothetical protein n=1 Tax=Paenibacillus sp. YPG26 TaxID=2878915 RepID=UPI00203BD0B2|nr:hypothetical protein [Paenibacillus sp. YPG26]USB32835.1 hypothetical protein LDO05_16530 [Paenibacillus sp. YPG26]
MLERNKGLFDLEQLILDMLLLMLHLQREIKLNTMDMYSSNMISNVNTLVSGLVKLNEISVGFSPDTHSTKLNDLFGEIGETFESIILAYNDSEALHATRIKSYFVDRLVPLFVSFRNDFDKYIEAQTGLKSVLISGLNYISIKSKNLINSNRGRIVAYISDEEEHQGGFIDNVPVLHSSDIEQFTGSYLIKTDSLSFFNKIECSIDLKEFIDNCYDFEVYRANQYFNSYKPSELNGFVTGLSYAEVGVDKEEMLPYNIVNLAVSSQDLYYDYQWIKLIVNETKVDFVFIGLSYYSFEYDLSKSKLKNRLEVYSPIFGKGDEKKTPYYNSFENRFSQIMNDHFAENLYDILRTQGESWWTNYVSRVMSDEDIKQGKEIALIDSNKNYPDTVLLNKRILTEMIRLLKRHNIKPILLVCPTSKYYQEHFSKRIKTEFEELISDIRNEDDIDILDFFSSEEFIDQDFYDVSHLNSQGSKKLTSMLKSYLKEQYFM